MGVVVVVEVVFIEFIESTSIPFGQRPQSSGGWRGAGDLFRHRTFFRGRGFGSARILTGPWAGSKSIRGLPPGGMRSRGFISSTRVFFGGGF